jgi:hypothetical protein
MPEYRSFTLHITFWRRWAVFMLVSVDLELSALCPIPWRGHPRSAASCHESTPRFLSRSGSAKERRCTSVDPGDNARCLAVAHDVCICAIRSYAGDVSGGCHHHHHHRGEAAEAWRKARREPHADGRWASRHQQSRVQQRPTTWRLLPKCPAHAPRMIGKAGHARPSRRATCGGRRP